MYTYGPHDSFTWETSEWRKCIKHQCLDCPYYNFGNEPAMLEHCRRYCHGYVKDGLLTTEDYIQAQAHLLPRGVVITLGYLCWNTKQASVEGAEALLKEVAYLHRLGCRANLVILDNGSSDGTYWGLRDCLPYELDSIILLRNIQNQGISRGRNRIIDTALGLESDYLLMLDGDIEVVPLSSYVMTRYLECHTELGCIGAYSSNYTQERKQASQHLYEIPEIRVKADIKVAWTQYGLFRCRMFEQGIRFDESGPFGEPGWGFEDDDLYFQMQQLGWGNKYFAGMRYLHRNIRSSWPNLEKSGINLESMFKRRKDYLLNKWAAAGFNQGILNQVSAQELPRGDRA